MKPVHPKLKATGLAGAVVIVVLWATGLVAFDQAVLDALTLLAATSAGWVKKAA